MATIKNPVTKENFFNALYEAYPEKVETFCKWVDEFVSSDINHD